MGSVPDKFPKRQFIHLGLFEQRTMFITFVAWNVIRFLYGIDEKIETQMGEGSSGRKKSLNRIAQQNPLLAPAIADVLKSDQEFKRKIRNEKSCWSCGKTCKENRADGANALPLKNCVGCVCHVLFARMSEEALETT